MVPPIFDFLSLRTFSSIWYWIAVAVTWAVVSHRPMGIPYDMIWRATRDEGAARSDLDAVAQAFCRRVLTATASGRALMVAFVSAVLTALLLLAFAYRLEFAQGVLLLALPLTIVAWLSVRTAHAIYAGGDPIRHLGRLRLAINAIALVFLFLTAFWGMYVNLMASVL